MPDSISFDREFSDAIARGRRGTDGYKLYPGFKIRGGEGYARRGIAGLWFDDDVVGGELRDRLPQRLHLVLHERDQRRDHQGQAG